MIPILRNWAIVNLGPEGSYQINGQVLGHKKFFDGDAITTSDLIFIDFKHGIAKTKNNMYSLSKPANGTIPLGTPEDGEVLVDR